MKHSAYPKYKKSGVEWLGDVPEHWDVKQARRCLLEHKQGYYSTDVYVDDGFKLLRITDLDGNGFVKTDDCPSVEIKDDAVPFLLRDSDFVFARTGGAGSFGLVRNLKEKTVFASYLIRFRFNKKTYVDFLRYNFLSKQFVHGIIHGGVNQNVHAEDIKDQFIPLPPLPEQQAIAEFLDCQTGRIDLLIGKKQKLIELLKEKRTALISRAVTKGLNPKAKMKPSGVEWLGNVPEHWIIKKLRYICNVQTGDKDTVDAVDDGAFPFFVRSQTVERIDSFTCDCEAVLTAGDGVGVGKVFHYVNSKFDFHQRVYMFNNFKKIIGTFFFYYFRENFWKVAFDGGAKSTVDSLRRPMITNFIMVVPPLDEQQAIVDFLDRETNQIDALITKVETAIEKLKEYRTALISAAVTGKIDVREAV